MASATGGKTMIRFASLTHFPSLFCFIEGANECSPSGFIAGGRVSEWLSPTPVGDWRYLRSAS
ncbi:MAG: hypothetical protein L3K10_08620 [Thermoplasmata archaeon]|nr:hypothetical protein [Thermoplasmata archaeon]